MRAKILAAASESLDAAIQLTRWLAANEEFLKQ